VHGFLAPHEPAKGGAMRCLELFAGIGGFAASFPDLEIVRSVDVDLAATRVYRANFKHPSEVREISSLPLSWFNDLDAEALWMSPPCSPFSRRGAFHDLNDNRSKALLRLIDIVCETKPAVIGMENVVGFENSQVFQMLRSRWSREGYRVETCNFCPTQIGWPNRRPRIYVLASLEPKVRLNRNHDFETMPPIHRLLLDEPEQEVHEGDRHLLWLTEAVANQYRTAIDKVDGSDPSAVTACFASSYGRTVIRSGSYLRVENRFRRFVPREVARLLGFPDEFVLPKQLDLRTQWRLLGNSLSLVAVRNVFKDVFTKKD
jgi:site-specific DNA-cytosine methylase